MRAARLVIVAGLLAASCGGSSDRLSGDALPEAPARIHVSSPAFTDGARLAKRYTCDGAGDEPAVDAGTVPASTSELAVVVLDPDAPGGPFVHLTRYGLNPRVASLQHDGSDGTNSSGSVGWRAPCPPKGAPAHHYAWHVYALREPSGLKAGAKPEDVAAALRHSTVLATGTLTARYGR